MWPGVVDPKSLGEFNKDDVRYITTPENEKIALGAMACGSDELSDSIPTGPAMYILHIINDKLWENGPKKAPE
jgi:predicted ribosome-associated RNA-binding protein Tma20